MRWGLHTTRNACLAELFGIYLVNLVGSPHHVKVHRNSAIKGTSFFITNVDFGGVLLPKYDSGGSD